MSAALIESPRVAPSRRALVLSFGLFGVMWLALGAGCKPKDGCFGSGPATPKKYEDCQRQCDKGNTKACDQRTELESELSQLCHLRSKKSACRAMCHGRLKDQTACRELRSLP